MRRCPDSFYSELASDHRQKRDLLCDALADAGLPPSVPDGAYYVLADVSRLPGATARDKARTLLEHCGVAAVAGSAFFRAGRGEHLLRFCFAKKQSELERACAQLRACSL